ncbi:hypothetical protein T4D_10915 [Trichinella pseudospiralis]|uniref:Uncharacterized protein n=1 Tax=Trichinella pseudospiralis TaxID=6337 RepID=A0A0V1F9G7_TRIPS|nr:hypothetical protein T4D_10915 [Trichinella pseudospiralis]
MHIKLKVLRTVVTPPIKFAETISNKGEMPNSKEKVPKKCTILRLKLLNDFSAATIFSAQC